MDKIGNLQGPVTKEEEELSHFVSKARRAEFLAGRIIAKKAIAELGLMPSEILRSESGCPVWPEGIAGSISHKRGICGAFVSVNTSNISLGFDIETVESLQESIWTTYSSVEEMNQASCSIANESVLANTLFSAKEACFKALYPVLGTSTPDISKLFINIIPLERDFHFNCLSEGIVCVGGIAYTNRHVLTWCKVKNTNN